MYGFDRYSRQLVLSWALEHAQVLRRGRARIATGQGVHLNRPGMSSFRQLRALAIMTTTFLAAMTVVCMISRSFSSFQSATPSSIYTARRQPARLVLESITEICMLAITCTAPSFLPCHRHRHLTCYTTRVIPVVVCAVRHWPIVAQ